MQFQLVKTLQRWVRDHLLTVYLRLRVFQYLNYTVYAGLLDLPLLQKV